MYSNILIPVAIDHGETTQQALEVARALCSPGGTITALTVMEHIPAYVAAELPAGQIDRSHKMAHEALQAEMGAGIECRVVTGHPGRTITDFADESGADCIVIASHQPGLQDYFLGSTAARVVRHAHCAVHVVR